MKQHSDVQSYAPLAKSHFQQPQDNPVQSLGAKGHPLPSPSGAGSELTGRQGDPCCQTLGEAPGACVELSQPMPKGSLLMPVPLFATGPSGELRLQQQ